MKSGGFIANNFGLFFGGIWLVVGLPFLLVALWQWHVHTRFSEEAVRVEGTVLTKEISRARRQSGSSTQYELSYRFETPDGQTLQGRQAIDVDLWDSLAERGPVEIEFLPDDPSSNRVATQANWILIWVFGGMGGLFTIAGGIIFGISLKRRLGKSRILKQGQPATATVTSVEQTRMSVDKVRQWRIRYQYLDMYGVQHDGHSGYVSPREAESWKEGDHGQVYHDPQQPEKSVWVGRPDVTQASSP